MMRREGVAAWGVALFFVLLAWITFRCVWPEGLVFNASDLSIGRLAFKKQALPELLTGQFSANQLMGSSGYSLTLFHLLLALFPLTFFANTIYGFILLLGSFSMVWYLRLWGCGWIASTVGALSGFWFNSVLLAAAGHAYKQEVLAFFVLSLALIEKAVRSERLRVSLGFGLLTGLSVGVMMIAQQDVALLAGLFLAPYALFRLCQTRSGWRRSGLLLGAIAGVSLLLSGHTILTSYQKNIAGASAVQGEATEKWDYITQWSLVPDEWPDLIAPGWSGWSTFHPDEPYWGRVGQSAEFEKTGEGFRNFRLESNYFGVLPFLLAFVGIASACRAGGQPRRGVVLFWTLGAGCALGLAFGRYSALYEVFFQIPIFNSIRAPIKLLDNMQIALGVLAAFGVEALIRGGAGGRVRMGALIGCVGVAVGLACSWMGVAIFEEQWRARFTQAGFATQSEVLLARMSHAWLHALVCTGVGGVSLFLFFKQRWRLAGALLIGLLCMDSLLLTSRYFKSDNLASIERMHPALAYLKAHQEAERSVFLDQNGIYNNWVGVDGPYHGLQLFNVWQMPRMPWEYQNYVTSVGQDQMRLWKLSAVKYVCMPASVYESLRADEQWAHQFMLRLRYKIPTAQGVREDVIVELLESTPRLSFFSGWYALPLDKHTSALVSDTFDMGRYVVIEPDQGYESVFTEQPFIPLRAEINKRKVSLVVNAQNTGIIRFAQRYQPGWRVFVDGVEKPLLKVDYLSMGVAVEAGSHMVEFRCVSGVKPALFSGSILIISLTGAGFCLRRAGGRRSGEI